MTALRDRVEAELREAFGADRIAPWDIQSAGDHRCTVHTDDFTLVFGFDDRDPTLLSSITFRDAGDWLQDSIDLNAVCGITALFDVYLDEDDSIETALSKHIKALALILSRIESGDLSVRNLLFYYFGHNDGADPGRLRRRALRPF